MSNSANGDTRDPASPTDEIVPSTDSALTRRQALRRGASLIAVAAISARSAGVIAAGSDAGGPARIEMSFDEDWRFYRGDASGAQASSFDDSAWRALDVPHDWRIEDLSNATADDGGTTANPSLYAYQTTASSDDAPPPVIGPFDVTADPTPDIDLEIPGFGRILMPGGRSQGYTVAGIGWYRKRFRIPARHHGEAQRVELRFDGVYQNADIWLNGIPLGFHPNGYSTFAYDLTPHLHSGKDNVLAVRVDNRGKTSRWYSGSGIYRHTWLTITAHVRIPLWGVRVTTPVADSHRSVARVDVQIANSGVDTEASVRMSVMDAQGRTIATQTTRPSALAGGATATHSAEIVLQGAGLWSPEHPTLHHVRTEVLLGARILDTVTTPFGIRSLAFNGVAGFLLNGKPYKLRGGNIHHDHGPLGTAAIDRAEERTIEVMKAAGFNAIRAAHNPPSPTMLDVCDRLGILVLEEFSDMWDIAKTADDYHRYFPEWWQRDLSAMVLRDRNHPCIIYWSVGNEIPSDPNKYGPRLAALVRSLDTTRPVGRGGMNVAGMTGAGADSDTWSYVDLGDFHSAPSPAERAAHQDKAFMQSEDTSPEMYADWKLARDNPWYVGTWVWSGWDYIGESGSGAPILAPSLKEAGAAADGPATGKIPYPWFNNCQGDIDLIGQRKPQNYLRAVIEGFSTLEMMVERPTPPGLQQFNVGYSFYDELPSWTWDVVAGQPMIVRVYSSGDSVTLLLNDQRVGSKGLTEADKRIATFTVPYAPGELVAVAHQGDTELARKALATTGRPTALRLTSDVRSLTVSRGDLAHVLVEVVDDRGHLVPDAVVRVSFAVEGSGALVGVGNGNPHNVDSFQRPRRWTWQGKALAILRPAKRAGRLTLTASADELRPGKLDLLVARAISR
jgi:beta-galactosidase